MLTRARTARFGSHYVDPQAEGADLVIAGQVAARGVVMVDGLTSRRAVLDFARRIMTLVPHPDSDPDGLTTIQNIGRASRQPGLAGLGSGELHAHTERSSVPRPPRLMLLVCLRPAASGGEVLLTDGRAVLEDLAATAPRAIETMSLRGTAFYGDGGGHPSRIFTPHGSSRISIRFRQDGLGQFSPLVSCFLPALGKAIAANEHAFALESGQGYLIDNARLLHARAAFLGPRLCVRALGMPSFPLPDGFSLGSAASGCRADATSGPAGVCGKPGSGATSNEGRKVR
ncbi:TauD/TfdA family dioxygenase [Streptomyces sp. NPDC048272]|uniref:TauD/TfdA family dioxygenase n=1 Tax=Streptomyces sp. NPDC048272 TaxID=3154616 RepID=UPI003425385C